VTGSRRPRRTATRNCSITLALVLDESTAGMGSWRMTDKVHELWEREKITVVERDMDLQNCAVDIRPLLWPHSRDRDYRGSES
jgi:hypothetical protein